MDHLLLRRNATSRWIRRGDPAVEDRLDDLVETDLTQPGIVFQIGVPPLRVDVVTSIEGVSFFEAWPARLQTSFGDQPVVVPSREHLIRNKRATGRTQDLADAKWLEAASRGGSE
jgi:hypothetical protein